MMMKSVFGMLLVMKSVFGIRYIDLGNRRIDFIGLINNDVCLNLEMLLASRRV